jgi:GxxExxY protein
MGVFIGCLTRLAKIGID